LAQLYLAKEFLPDYGKLEKHVQNEVFAAVGKFGEHTHAGLHLEKLADSKDDRIRTIRIDAFWRGVVLAPASGDVYCLLAVLPHDKAIDYAKSRRFSVNHAIGALEVRDEAALAEIQPSLEASVGPADGLLFARFSDADLTRLGVDASVLPIVRLLTTEAQLEALQALLPEVQYTALYALACGMSPDEAWAEVCQYLPTAAPPPVVDPTDLVAAMRRTPGQITLVSGPAELQQILAHPFAAWRTFLHPSQRAIACHPSYAGPAQVTGGAGTGKTVTALHRAAFLARRAAPAGPGTQEGPAILLTTFTSSLAEALDAQLALLVGDERVRRRIEVVNVDKLANRVVRQARGAVRIAEPADVRGRFASAAASAGADISSSFLESEWEQIILGQDLRAEDAYLGCERAGRGTPLSRTQRTQVWQLAAQVTADLQAAGESTYLQVTCEAARLLADSGGTLYRHVIVDEGQDLSPAQWRLLRAAVASGPDDLFIAADPHQRIYDNRVSLASLGINVRGRSRRLAVNYRTTAEILRWAVPLLGTVPVTGLDDEAASLLGYRSPVHGGRPEVHAAASRDAELDALAAHLRGWMDAGIEPSAIGVAARSSGLGNLARGALKATGVPTLALTTRSPKNAVKVGTMHRMKGLEFQAVAVIGVEDGSMPVTAAVTPAGEDPIRHAQDLQRERCLLFVACTRARDHLYISYTGEPSPFLPTNPA
jgi:superfamily I DNA/RNA helicase